MIGKVTLKEVVQIGEQTETGQIFFRATINADCIADSMILTSRVHEDQARPFALSYIDAYERQISIYGYIITVPGYYFNAFFQGRITEYLNNLIL